MTLLRTALMLNAASCIIFGVLFLAIGERVDAFIGNTYAWLTPIVGVVLVFNGCHLLFASKRTKPLCPEVLYFILGDVAWVLASLAFIAFGIVVTTSLGAIMTLLVAMMVGGFAILQVVGYKRSCA